MYVFRLTYVKHRQDKGRVGGDRGGMRSFLLYEIFLKKKKKKKSLFS